MSCCGKPASAKPKKTTGSDRRTQFTTAQYGRETVSVPVGERPPDPQPRGGGAAHRTASLSSSDSGVVSGSEEDDGPPPTYADAAASAEADAESDALNGRDFINLLDISMSMKFRLKNGQRRIDGVQEVLLEMAYASEKYDADGPTLITFSKRDKWNRYDNIPADQITDLIQTLVHESGSHLEGPLEEVLQGYIDARRRGGKKLLICIFHDGCPANRGAVIRIIKRFTHYLKSRDEVGITFIQANDTDDEARDFFEFLDDHLQMDDDYGPAAKFDIVDSKTIAELTAKGAKFGFIQALTD